jgi:endonuclease YncB( thermonuclease family)
MTKIFTRYATILKVTDGDTVVVDIDIGDGLEQRKRTIRLDNIDTPEMKGASQKERDLALKAKQFVESKLAIGQEYMFVSTKKKDKYDRALGIIQDAEGKDISTQLIQLGLAYNYTGGTKRDWSI